MLEKKEYVKLWVSYESYFEAYSAAEVGRLVLAMIKYRMSGVEPEFSGSERFIWPAIKRDLDESLKAQEAAAEVHRENGKKGGRPPKPNKPDVFSENQKNQIGFSESEKSHGQGQGQGKGHKEKPPNGGKEKGPVPGPDVWFERFWSAYPNHRCGKSSALKAWQKIKPSPALAEAIVAAVERQKHWEQWKRDGGQYIPMATTWLNQRRWDADDTKPEGGEQIGYFRAPTLPPVGD